MSNVDPAGESEPDQSSDANPSDNFAYVSSSAPSDQSSDSTPAGPPTETSAATADADQGLAETVAPAPPPPPTTPAGSNTPPALGVPSVPPAPSYATPSNYPAQGYPGAQAGTAPPPPAAPTYTAPGYTAPGYAAPGYATQPAQQGYPPAQQMNYGQPQPPAGYSQAPYYYAPPPPRGKSLASMIIGIASIVGFSFFVIPQIVGLIIGIIGLRTEPAGRSMAITGIITNALCVLGAVIGIVLVVATFAATYNSYY